MLICRKSWHSVPRCVQYVRLHHLAGDGYCVLVCKKSWHSVPRRCAVRVTTLICPGWTFSVGLQKIVALSATVCVVCATALFIWRWILCTSLREIVALSATPVCSLCDGFCFVVDARRSAPTRNRGTQCHGVCDMCTDFILSEVDTGYRSARNRGTQCYAGAQSVRQLSFCR
jgi:hypothetical protein